MAELYKDKDPVGRAIYTVALTRAEATQIIVGLVGGLSGTRFEEPSVVVCDMAAEPSPDRLAKVVFELLPGDDPPL